MNTGNQTTYPIDISTARITWLMDTYFSDPKKRIELKSGDVLLKENECNDRLYAVKEGVLTGYIRTSNGDPCETFKAKKQALIGIPSFFSGRLISLSTVVAETDAVVNFIDRSQPFVPDGDHCSLAEQFMPMIVSELVHRQIRVQMMAIEREKTLKMLGHHEKMAALGKISAGIAHELNNAIAVLMRNSAWLADRFREFIEKEATKGSVFFEKGLKEGRSAASAYVRKQTKTLMDQTGIPKKAAEQVAQMMLDQKVQDSLIQNGEETIAGMFSCWDTGVTIKDMMVASDHAVHVLKSMKELGAPQTDRVPGIDVNATIHEALALLSSPLRKVQVELSLVNVPTITAAKGELVQTWMNLIQNACESMDAGNLDEPRLAVTTTVSGKGILVSVRDNGPGIPKESLKRIFDPNYTTKSGGKTFGLGLGLTIVERLVAQYQWKLSVTSEPGGTEFKVHIPVGGDYE